MTTDEMVSEIRALYEAMHARPDVISETRIECVSEGTSATHGGYSAHAKTCTGALDALRGKLRAAASDALAEREAKAETLRKALGIIDRPDAPTCAHLDAVREYIAARNAHEEAKARPLSEQSSKTYDHLLDATAKLRDAMGGAL